MPYPYTVETKNKDINWVRTNPQTAKYHSVEMGDTLRRSSTAILRIAAPKLYGIRADFPWNSSDFITFLVTCTVHLESVLFSERGFCMASSSYIYIYIYIYVYVCMYVCMYIYLSRWRRRGVR